MIVPKPQKLGVGMAVCRKDRAYKPYSNGVICVVFACPVFCALPSLHLILWFVALPSRIFGKVHLCSCRNMRHARRLCTIYSLY